MKETNESGSRVSIIFTRSNQAGILISKGFKEGKYYLIFSSASDCLKHLDKEALLINKLNHDENSKRVKDAVIFIARNEIAKI